MADAPELAVDRSHLALHVLGERVVFRDALPRRHRDQDEENLGALVRMALEKPLHRREFLRNPLRVVEPLDVQDHPFA